jgi:hypothetical protein
MYEKHLELYLAYTGSINARYYFNHMESENWGYNSGLLTRCPILVSNNENFFRIYQKIFLKHLGIIPQNHKWYLKRHNTKTNPNNF